jgi:microcin C transport system substrate-binding protein
MKHYLLLAVLFIMAGFLTCESNAVPPPNAVSSLARFGKPKYDNDFKAFSYVNPTAPKGGKLVMGTTGTFDSLNDYVVKGTPAFNCFLITIDPLMRRSVDEPYTLYGLIAEKVHLAPDFSSITFYINPAARFHDGTPITAEDVKFSFEMLREQGLPRYRQFYGKIKAISLIDSLTIKLDFEKTENGYDPEIPMTVALLRVFSKASLQGKDFRETGLSPLLSNGPYKIAKAEAGRFIQYERIKNYWAADLPVNKGMYNFDTIRIDYYKTPQAQFQAFKAGEFDVFFEIDSQQWRKGYTVPAVIEGKIKKVSFKSQRPVTVRLAIFNMRRPLFRDIRVRKAIAYAFDWETMNKMLCDGDYQRVDSLFANTVLAHKGTAKGLELEYLSPWFHMLPKLTIEEGFIAPTTKGDGDARENLKLASQLLDQAGYIQEVDPLTHKKKGQRVNKETKEPLTFEFMYKDQRIEKFLNMFRMNLEKIGVTLKPRFIDTVQYEARVMKSDFDMIAHMWSNSLSPGNEQIYYFSQKMADQPGSSNYIGVKDPVLEALAYKVAGAQTEEEKIAAVHALDRVFMARHYAVPMFYDNTVYWAYWADRVDYPPFDPAVGTNTLDWWWAKSTERKTVDNAASSAPLASGSSFFQKAVDWVKSF